MPSPMATEAIMAVKESSPMPSTPITAKFTRMVRLMGTIPIRPATTERNITASSAATPASASSRLPTCVGTSSCSIFLSTLARPVTS